MAVYRTCSEFRDVDDDSSGCSCFSYCCFANKTMSVEISIGMFTAYILIF